MSAQDFAEWVAVESSEAEQERPTASLSRLAKLTTDLRTVCNELRAVTTVLNHGAARNDIDYMPPEPEHLEGVSVQARATAAKRYGAGDTLGIFYRRMGSILCVSYFKPSTPDWSIYVAIKKSIERGDYTVEQFNDALDGTIPYATKGHDPEMYLRVATLLRKDFPREFKSDSWTDDEEEDKEEEEEEEVEIKEEYVSLFDRERAHSQGKEEEKDPWAGPLTVAALKAMVQEALSESS